MCRNLFFCFNGCYVIDKFYVKLGYLLKMLNYVKFYVENWCYVYLSS